MYGDEEAADFIREHFVPLGLHAKRQADEFRRVAERLDVPGAAMAVVVDGSGEEILRIEGFHPPEDFVHMLGHALEHQRTHE